MAGFRVLVNDGIAVGSLPAVANVNPTFKTLAGVGGVSEREGCEHHEKQEEFFYGPGEAESHI